MPLLTKKVHISMVKQTYILSSFRLLVQIFFGNPNDCKAGQLTKELRKYVD
jgi:hypothetical protein